MVESFEIWKAITALADELFLLMPDEEETPYDHSVFSVVPGATAKTIMRKCGVRQRPERPLWAGRGNSRFGTGCR
jgi:hypothetical protein